MKLTAAQIQSATLSQCEDWLEEIALNIVVLDGKIYSTAGEERAGAERYVLDPRSPDSFCILS